MTEQCSATHPTAVGHVRCQRDRAHDYNHRAEYSPANGHTTILSWPQGTTMRVVKGGR